MGLEYAIDRLYASGWSAMDTRGCEHAADGRQFPSIERVAQEFKSAGCTLGLHHVQLFDCYRAQWSDDQGTLLGAVVGQTEQEAAIYALSRFRLSLTSDASEKVQTA